MKYLLDTHVIIWVLEGNSSLSAQVITTLEDPDNQIYFSPISLWEIAIKKSIGKLKLRYSIRDMVTELETQNMTLLPLTALGIEEVENLPFPEIVRHADPFDRALIAQARSSDLTIITKDDMFKHYDVDTFW